MTGVVEAWFGQSFGDLDPLIQQLHRRDHILSGDIQIEYARGFAGVIGRSIGRKFGIPTKSGSCLLTVNICHAEDHLLWSRQFGEDGKVMVSKFYPVGCYPDGGWRERTGGVDIILGVEIKQGAWHWKQKSVIFHGMQSPLFVSPKVTAYKEVVNNKYNFHVEFSLPRLGRLFTYKGLLSIIK